MMNLEELFEHPLIEIETSLKFKVLANIPVLGRKEIIELKVDGFKDDDGDGDIEFTVSLEIFDGDIMDIEEQEIELPTSLVRKALSGDTLSLGALFGAVKKALKKKGVTVPF